MTDGGYGWMDPGDVSHPYNAASFHIWQVLSRVRTGTIVKVIAVHVEAGVSPVGTVDVQPLIQMVNGNLVATSHGTIFGLPYFRLQGGSNAIIIDPAPDDIGIAQISDRDISNVKSAKAEAPPGSQRKFDLADGIYIGGILNGAPTQYLRFTADGISWVDALGNQIISSSTGIDLTPKSGQPVTVHGDQVVTGGSTIDGNATIDGSAHIVGGVQIDGSAIINGTLEVAGGATIHRILTGSATFTGTTVNSLAFASQTATIAGAQVGDLVILGPASAVNPFLPLTAWVSSANTVTIRMGNPSANPLGFATVVINIMVVGVT